MTYGYCRISRAKQSIERQIRNIEAEYPEAVIIQEVFTRTRLDRKEWPKLYKAVKAGDTIVFDSVSRMSGEAENGYNTYIDLYNKGVNLVFLKEPHINTDVFKRAIQNRIELTGENIDLILSGVNAYLMELAKEQIKIAKSLLDILDKVITKIPVYKLACNMESEAADVSYNEMCKKQ